MKKEYDFSKAERGRFYKKGATLNVPIYLDKKNQAFVEGLAQRTNRDVSDITNELLHANQAIIKTIEHETSRSIKRGMRDAKARRGRFV